MASTEQPMELDQESLWRTHGTDLIRYATLLAGPADAGDIVSSAFTRVAAATSPIDNPRAYLMRAVTNSALDQRRSQQRRQVRDLHAVIPSVVADGAPDVDVRRAIAALSVQQRAVVYFTYWEDLDSNQIGDVLDITPASVRRHLARARIHLRKALS